MSTCFIMVVWVFFEELFKGRRWLCCFFLQTQYLFFASPFQKEVNYVHCTLLLKIVHKLRKLVSIFVFTKATTCNETALNSTHTFKYHKQEMNLLVSTKYKTPWSKTTCFGKEKEQCAKQPNFEKRNFHLQVPKVFLGKAKHF